MQVLERTYHMRSGIDDPGRFVVGDRGFAQLYGGVELASRVGAATGDGATTVVRDSPAGLRVTVYYPARMIRQLARFPPQHGLSEQNVDAFATLVEELDHLLVIADRAVASRPLTMFELELHANVSKHLVLCRFLAGREPKLAPADRIWLRHHLFNKLRFTEPDRLVRQRYRDARRWAIRLIDALPRLEPRARVGTLREFHRAAPRDKVELIDRLSRAA